MFGECCYKFYGTPPCIFLLSTVQHKIFFLVNRFRHPGTPLLASLSRQSNTFQSRVGAIGGIAGLQSAVFIIENAVDINIAAIAVFCDSSDATVYLVNFFIGIGTAGRRTFGQSRGGWLPAQSQRSADGF